MTRLSLLYSEMVVASALVRGGALHLLERAPGEGPVALQLGGSDPAELAGAAQLGVKAGFDEINLNVGCPSDRVQSGCFGAVLMRRPGLVADCVTAMADAIGALVTVKCRLGVDDQVPGETLPPFLEALARAGTHRVIIHARKAWLDGLSPKQNRDVPPLDYPLVFAMKRAFPELHLSINGGVGSIGEARALLDRGMDGVMIGRAAYRRPYDVLAPADRVIFGGSEAPSRHAVGLAMARYTDAHVAAGGRAHDVTRHMLGLFSGCPGARSWRQTLSAEATHSGATGDVLRRALDRVPDPQAMAAE